MKRIVVHIDRVTLRGIDAADKDVVAGALRRSIVDQLSLPGAADRLAGLGHLESVRTKATPKTSGSVGSAAGEAVGKALAR